MEPLLSVIIPTYNSSAYIEKCCDSITEQTIFDLEIIIVDDGSTDNTYELLKKIACGDERLKIIKKENGGPNSARELGIKYATGKFIAFVDSDDYIENVAFAMLLEEMTTTDADIIEFGYCKISSEGKLEKRYELVPVELYNEKCLEHYVQHKNTTNFLWNKLYKKQLFEGVRFPHFYAGEDQCVLIQLYYKTKKIVTVPYVLYNYVITTDSLCRKPFSEKRLDNIQSNIFIFNYLDTKCFDGRIYYAFSICYYCAQIYAQMQFLGNNYYRNNERLDKKNKMKDICATFDKYYFILRQYGDVKKYVSLKQMLHVKLFKRIPYLYAISYKIKKGKI